MLVNLRLKYKEFFLILIFIPLFLISALRNGLGTDYYSYANSYLFPETWAGEFLFKLIFITLPRFICENEITFFLITSFILNLFFLKAICRYSQIIPLSLLIYITQFYFISFNAVRQFLCISLFVYFCSKFLNKDRLGSYFLFVIFLAQMHYFFYILLIFPLLGNHEYNIKTYWLIWGMSFAMFLFQTYNIINISTLFWFTPNLAFISNKFIELNDAATFFFDKYSSNYQLVVKNLFCVAFLLRLIHFKGSPQIYWVNLFLFGTILSNILVKFSLYAVRIAYFGDVALIILVPFYINSFENKRTRIFLILFFCVYFFINFYYRFVMMGESEVFMQNSPNWLPKSNL